MASNAQTTNTINRTPMVELLNVIDTLTTELLPKLDIVMTQLFYYEVQAYDLEINGTHNTNNGTAGIIYRMGNDVVNMMHTIITLVSNIGNQLETCESFAGEIYIELQKLNNQTLIWIQTLNTLAEEGNDNAVTKLRGGGVALQKVSVGCNWMTPVNFGNITSAMNDSIDDMLTVTTIIRNELTTFQNLFT